MSPGGLDVPQLALRHLRACHMHCGELQMHMAHKEAAAWWPPTPSPACIAVTHHSGAANNINPCINPKQGAPMCMHSRPCAALRCRRACQYAYAIGSLGMVWQIIACIMMVSKPARQPGS